MSLSKRSPRSVNCQTCNRLHFVTYLWYPTGNYTLSNRVIFLRNFDHPSNKKKPWSNHRSSSSSIIRQCNIHTSSKVLEGYHFKSCNGGSVPVGCIPIGNAVSTQQFIIHFLYTHLSITVFLSFISKSLLLSKAWVCGQCYTRSSFVPLFSQRLLSVSNVSILQPIDSSDLNLSFWLIFLSRHYPVSRLMWSSLPSTSSWTSIFVPSHGHVYVSSFHSHRLASIWGFRLIYQKRRGL